MGESGRKFGSSFVSILDPKKSPYKERQRPPFYQDLNLDQVIDKICTVWGEDVSCFYYYLPAGRDCEDYRREVYGDIRLEGIYGALRDFTEKMKVRREIFVKKEEVSHKLQKAVWHIREADDYCRAFSGLYEALRTVIFKSEGMRSFLSYLEQYLATAEFCEMQKEAAGLLEEMATFRLVVTYRNDRIAVVEGEVPGTYDAFLEKCFPGQNKRMQSPFETEPELVELEQEMLKVFRKKSPNFFVRAEAFLEKYEVYAEDALLRFASEIRYYLSFYCFEEKMKELGFSFCAPVMTERQGGQSNAQGVRMSASGEMAVQSVRMPSVSGQSGIREKGMYARGLYDLALACANMGSRESIVSNDMEYRDGESFFVLTGPNQGGKTTFARSLGQLVCLAKMGLDVPADCAALYRFPDIMTHFSVEESVETGRGKLMDELNRLLPVMDASGEGNFVVINELFTTAANYDACIMGKRVLEHLLKQGCMGIYVTHLTELSEAHPRIVSLSAMLDGQGERSFKISRNRAAGHAGVVKQAEKFRLTYEQLKERLA